MEYYVTRTMWMVDNPTYVSEVKAYLDADGNVAMYHNGEDVFTFNDNRRFFDTEEEARKWQAVYREELYAKMKQCRELIQELDELYPSDEFPFKDEDYLGRYAHHDIHNYREDYVLYKDICYILATAITNKMLNINGKSVALSEVVAIKWHNEDKATVVLKDGRVQTHSKAEYKALRFIFGANNSGRFCIETNK